MLLHTVLIREKRITEIRVSVFVCICLMFKEHTLKRYNGKIGSRSIVFFFSEPAQFSSVYCATICYVRHISRAYILVCWKLVFFGDIFGEILLDLSISLVVLEKMVSTSYPKS